jgi:hypothetical protein
MVVIPKQLAYQINTFFIKKLQISPNCCVITEFLPAYEDLGRETNRVPGGNVVYKAANESRIFQ